MTLSRDVFAAIAMHGLLAKEGPGEFDFDIHPADVLRVAAWSFDMGDTMVRYGKASEEEIQKMFKDAKESFDYQSFVTLLEARDKREKARKKRLTKKETKNVTK